MDALAIARADQARDIGWAHPASRFVAQILQIRLKPVFEIALPILFHRQPPSKLAPYESRIFLTGNPKNYASAKVVLGSGLIDQSQKMTVAASAMAEKKLLDTGRSGWRRGTSSSGGRK
ncbi:hypothetical protein H4W01_002166 [Sphingomonas sp. PL20]